MAHFLFPLAFLRLQYLGWPVTVAVFLAMGAFIVSTGMFSLAGLEPIRRWVAISLRLTLLAVLLLVIAGAQWSRKSYGLEVMFVRDISQSTENVRQYPGKSLQSSLDTWMLAAGRNPNKQSEDTMGVVSFNDHPLIDLMFTDKPQLDNRSIRDPGTGTDAAAALNLALAAFQKDSMHRIVLAWDGNSTTGDMERAIAAATAAHVPVDVVPLNYDINDAVVMDRFIAPTSRREKDPFTLDIVMRSTAATPVTGTLTVTRNAAPLATQKITLKPGPNVQHIPVPALNEPGLQRFHASFEPDSIGATADARSADALRSADAFTFVKGRGKILYVDAVENSAGETLRKALRSEGIDIDDAAHITPDHFPTSTVDLQAYDAVILANVSRGGDGLSEEQQAALTSYVHDTGGGLVDIGGPNAFGAGGWQGSKLEQILPVNMDVPAQRQIPKGALVLVMDPCEIPEGTYWGLQCGIQAVSALSSEDEIGIISWTWGGNQGAQYKWDLPLQKKGDGQAAIAALKRMDPGDMPEFDAPLKLALEGTNGNNGLLDSTAQQKHIIIISDGDPGGVSETTYNMFRNKKISVSTVEAFAHDTNDPNVTPVMKEVADRLQGRAYGPLNQNPNQLPKIFIKEATVVRRTLIQEKADGGIPLALHDPSSELVKGITETPPVFGMVLTSRKTDPRIELPLVAGKMSDPVLASWQAGLGRSVAFTSDATSRWATNWLAGGEFPKFWAQVVRSVVRPPVDNDLEMQTSVSGDKGRIGVQAMGADGTFQNFQSLDGTLIGPDLQPVPVKLVQTAPGEYEGNFDARKPGEYVVILQRQTGTHRGLAVGGVSVSTSEELRDLHSNPHNLAEVANRTGGRILTPFDAQVDLFNRDGLAPAEALRPIWDILIPLGLALLLLDVACRRIAWDRRSIAANAARAGAFVRSFTETRAVTGDPMVGALRRAKDTATERTRAEAPTKRVETPVAAPDPKARFSAKSNVDGDISKVVGGASNSPVRAAPTKLPPSATPSTSAEGMSSLMAAKKRARDQIDKTASGEQ